MQKSSFMKDKNLQCAVGFSHDIEQQSTLYIMCLDRKYNVVSSGRNHGCKVGIRGICRRPITI